MLHRSTLLAILSAALLLPAAAQAADPVVAGPLPDGTTATATAGHGDLCVSVRVPRAAGDQPDAAFSDHPLCDALPVLGPLGFADGLAGGGGDGDGVPTSYDAGVTGTDIAAVELRKGGKAVAHVATQPSPLPGAPDLRFYVIAGAGDPDEVAFLDASGTVRRAADLGGGTVPLGDVGSGPPTTPARVVARGQGLRGGRWTLSAHGTRGIVSTPLQPERRLAEACVSLTWSAGGANGANGTCDQPGLEAAAIVIPTLTDDGCGGFGRYVGGLVRARVARLVAVLGDGRRRAIALHPVPAAFGGPRLRAGVVVVSTRAAVRSLVAYDTAGRAIWIEPVRSAPKAPQRCAAAFDGELGASLITFGPGNPDRPLGAGPHALHVADDGDRICLAADRAPVAPGDCVEAPVDPDRADLLAQPEAGGRYVYGIVPPEIATARLTLDDGSTRDLPAAPIAAYGGQYAAVLRGVGGDVPGPHRPVAFRLLDARGRALATGGGPDFPAFGPARALGRVPGLGPLYAASFAVSSSIPQLRTLPGCVSVGRPVDDLSRQRCLPTSRSELLLTPSCATHRTIVSVGLAHRADRVRVVLASGRTVALRTLTLPATRQSYEGAALAVGVLGPHDAPRAVIRRGRSPKRLALDLPPAGAQCGYTFDAELDAPDID